MRIHTLPAPERGTDVIAWLDGFCNRIDKPQWLDKVADYPWSGVFTSSIDDIWLRAFRLPWRDIQVVYDDRYKFHDIRSTTHLHSVFLYGSVGATEEDQKPPLNTFEKSKRRPIALSLLNRLPELVSPFGMLIIEGYAGDQDWITPEDIYPVIESLGINQVHIFSADQSLHQNEFLHHLMEANKLILHEESLYQILAYGYQAGYLDEGHKVNLDYGYSLYINSKPVELPVDMRNQIAHSAIVLDAVKIATPPHLSPDRVYQEYKNFLWESSYNPIWDGYYRGFSFTREFEYDLREQVIKRLARKELDSDALILHGQTGTGKTIALGALAYEVAKEKKYPVIFLERKSARPSFGDIDTFLSWTEDNEANKTLIVWDGMLEFDVYEELRRYLADRGRKAVLVGSCYRMINPNLSRKTNFIEAPATLSNTEQEQFREYLNKIDPQLVDLIDNELRNLSDQFLVALYRLIPESRSQIRRGIIREIELEEDKIRELIKEEDVELALGTMALALLRNGLINKEMIINRHLTDDDEPSDCARQLIGFVMVPGQFGLKVPIELLLRVIKQSNLIEKIKDLNERDIFRWTEDEVGNIYIVARNPLEAQVFIQYQFWGIEDEIKFVTDLINNITVYNWQLNNNETQFAVDLIRSFGPQNRKSKYSNCYRELADALRYLREKRGINQPRLMLQEASLLREWVLSESSKKEVPKDAEDILSMAENIMKEALEIIDQSPHKSRELKVFCLVERASIIGTKIIHIINQQVIDKNQLVKLYRQVRNLLIEARSLYPENYYSYDVGLWTAHALLGLSCFNEAEQMDLKGDIKYTVEMAKSQGDIVLLDPRYNERLLKIDNVLQEEEISEEAFSNLLNQGSCAGIYLRSQQMVEDIPRFEVLNDDQIDKCKTALNYMQQFENSVEFDERCMWLELNLWWKSKVGKPLFFAEREALAFSQSDWKELINLLTRMINNPYIQQKPSVLYLKGLALFHLKRFQEANECFKQIERDFGQIRFERRIYRHYVFSSPEGNPVIFNGMVKTIKKNGRYGKIMVDELRTEVEIIFNEFKRSNVQVGDSINGFHIAFNYIGPNADPPAYYKMSGR